MSNFVRRAVRRLSLGCSLTFTVANTSSLDGLIAFAEIDPNAIASNWSLRSLEVGDCF